jgi:hypothetical protein
MLRFVSHQLFKVLLTAIWLCLSGVTLAHAQVPSTGWPTVAGNLARTGWVADQAQFISESYPVNGEMWNFGTFIQWYRPIEAYIPNYVNIIAANDLVYISSARGLYALRYDTGELIWRFDTQLPLGNSPTIATIAGTSLAFVGGYDKHLYALNALTGEVVWDFADATAGYQANPIVADGMVYAGNRDGHLYALNANTGQLNWQYPPADQAGLGPIKQSPAYKNGVIYFTTDYQYAYALQTNGSLLWRSTKLTGNAYDAYWPVIFTDTTVNPAHDYVIFTSGLPYREEARPGTRSIDNNGSYYFYALDAPGYGQPVTVNEPWAQGKTILNYQSVIDEYQQKPWRKFYTILDAVNGQEYPIPFPALPVLSPGIQHPPIIDPQNNLIFTNNLYTENRTRVMGWRFGTPYFALTAIDDANDEPMIISGGGNNLYESLCCMRKGVYVPLNNLLSTNYMWPYWDQVLETKAPGFDTMIFYLDPMYLAQISAAYGNRNGIYGYHGDQNPIISYKNMAFIHRGNAILAFGNGPNRCPLARDTQHHCHTTVTANAPAKPHSTPTTQELATKLETEIQAILTACDTQNTCGFLKPAFLDEAQFNSWYSNMQNYYEAPADTLYTLSQAYPHISNSNLKEQLRIFLTTKWYPKYFRFDNSGSPVISVRTGWVDGVQRDASYLPNEVVADFANFDQDYSEGTDGRWSWFDFSYLNLNPNTFYAMYLYAKNVAPNQAETIYNLAKAKLTTQTCQWNDCFHVPASASDTYLTNSPHELNAYIAGYQGFINLLDLAGKTATDAELRHRAATELDRLINLRLSTFSKNSPFSTVNNGYGKTMLNLSRNFLMLTPELADMMRSQLLSDVQAAITEYNQIGPYWFVPHFDAATAESGFQNLYDVPSLFQAKAWILQENREELVKYLDVPAFPRGDLFYIQNLVAALEAPSDPNYTPPPASPTQIPIDTDLDNDDDTDFFDLLNLIFSFNTSGPGNFNRIGLVDIFDFNLLIQNL